MDTTNGEWKVFEVDGVIGVQCNRPGAGDICHTFIPYEPANGRNEYDSTRTREESLANARLIASAPQQQALIDELARALKQGLSDLRWVEGQGEGNNFKSSIILAEHALTKAERKGDE